MPRMLLSVLLFAAQLVSGCVSHSSTVPAEATTAPVATSSCSMESASPWIERWFEAWELASQRIMQLPDAPPPEILFFDASCVYTTSPVAAGDAPVLDGPTLGSHELPWRAFPHDGSIRMPDASETEIALMSFTSATPESGPYFVMAAPSYWTQMGLGDDPPTAVFLHEFAHTRQVRGMGPAIGSIDDSWPFEEELNDDAVQKHFENDPEYVAAYLAERDLLYRAAVAESIEETRKLAAEALSMMRNRHARWFTGEKAMFAAVDNIFLAMEGVGQWTAYAWLLHPDGGGLDREAAIRKMLGRGRFWAQDEGLILMLVVDRLLPEWPSLAFSVPALGAIDLLERAVQQESASSRGAAGSDPNAPSFCYRLRACVIMNSALCAPSGRPRDF